MKDKWEEPKMEKKGFRKISEDELNMVNGGAGEYIEPEPASLPDPESHVPQSSARTDPEKRPLNYIWDK